MELYIHTLHFIVYLLVGTWISLAAVSNAVKDTGMQVSIWAPAFNSLCYIPRIAGSYDNSMFNF